MRDWLSHRVVSSPEDTALVRAEDGEAWTYTDLDQLVSETAGRLAAHGIEAGDTLGVLTPPYVGTVGLIHAAMRIGATFVPLGEGLTERELAKRIDGVDLSAVVCAESTENKALGAVTRTEDIPVFSVDKPGDERITAVHDVEPEPLEPTVWEFDDTLCVLFTSGTTGDPKPVPLSVGNVYSSAVASAFRLGVDGDDRWLVSLALHHMGGLAPVYRSVLYGTTLILRKGFDPGGTADDIDTYDVTGVSLVPTMLRQMLDRRGTLSDSLRVVLLGGAPAPNELLERCRDYSIPVYPTYGMTEAASQIATATPRQTRNRLDTVGRPIFGTDVTVVDEDNTPVLPGETGEIVVSGATVTRGYIDDETEALDRSSFGPHGLHTGDVGRFDKSGYLYVLNRLDDRIISGGENVEPGEVVDVIRDFPAVENAAVIGLDDDMWGERVSALVAVGDRFQDDNGSLAVGEATDTEGPVSTDDQSADRSGDEERTNAQSDSDRDEDADPGRDGESAIPDLSEAETAFPVDEGALIEFIDDRLAGFKLPKRIAYVDTLPRTVSGTVDREAVKTILRNRGHDPRGETEGELEMAGFKPADPADPPEPKSDEPESDGNGSASETTDDDGASETTDDDSASETTDDDSASETTDDDSANGTTDDDSASETTDDDSANETDVIIPDAEEADKPASESEDAETADAVEHEADDEPNATDPDN